MPSAETPRQPQASLLWDHCSFLLGPGAQGSVMPSTSLFPSPSEFERTPGVGDGQGGLACCNSWGREQSDTTEQLNWTELNWCKLWQLYSGVNGDLLQEDLCHTYTQSPCPCGRPLPTYSSPADVQTQFCLSLCGVPGSWSPQGLFEPSEHLWQEQDLILNTNSPLLPSCWGFSFALGRGLSPHSHSRAYCLTGVFWPWIWDVSTLPVQRSAGAAPDLGHGVSPLSRSRSLQLPLTTPADHINPLLIISFANIFSYSVGYLFILLIVSLAV